MRGVAFPLTGPVAVGPGGVQPFGRQTASVQVVPAPQAAGVVARGQAGEGAADRELAGAGTH